MASSWSESGKGDVTLGRFLHIRVRFPVCANVGEENSASLGRLPAFVRAKRAVRVPNVLEPTAIAAVIAQLSGMVRLVVMLMYGAGLRLEEALTLRVKDVDGRRRVLTVRGGKGSKDCRTMLPETLVEAMTDAASPAMPYGMRSRRIFSRAATPSARYKRCLVTAMSARL